VILTYEEHAPDTTPQLAHERCLRALESVGFTLGAEADPAATAATATNPGATTLRRGSAWGNLLSFRMERLAQTVTVECESGPGAGSLLRLRYAVQTWGQFITDADRGYFAAEARWLAAQARGDDGPHDVLAAQRTRVRRVAWVTLTVAAVLGVTVAVLAGLLRLWI